MTPEPASEAVSVTAFWPLVTSTVTLKLDEVPDAPVVVAFIAPRYLACRSRWTRRWRVRTIRGRVAPEAIGPADVLRLITAPLSETLFPWLSWTCTVTAGVIVIPANASKGSLVKLSKLAVPASMMTLFEVSDVNPVRLALSA